MSETQQQSSMSSQPRLAPGQLPPSDTMTLFCWVFGDAWSFSVEISREKIINHLKKAIVAKKPNRFWGINADKLVLWQAKIPDNDEAFQNFDLKYTKELQPLYLIRNYFKGYPLKKNIHIVIRTPGK
ncbi:hypothetical protein RUND412_010234 [Rhizina undulata]